MTIKRYKELGLKLPIKLVIARALVLGFGIFFIAASVNFALLTTATAQAKYQATRFNPIHCVHSSKNTPANCTTL